MKFIVFLILFFFVNGNSILTAGETDLYIEEKIKELQEKLHEAGYSIKFFSDKRFKVYKETPIQIKTMNKANYFSPFMGIFTEKSFEQSLNFIEENKNFLIKAEKQFKVDKEYIVAILQIESNFGRKVGKWKVINALVSMYVNNRKWVLNEIKHFIDLEGKLYDDIFAISGSYAGAFGIAQSLPSSYKNFGVDFDNDGVIDPMSVADAIGFVGNYLHKCGFGKTEESKRKAIFAYNRQWSYVDAISEYAKNLKERLKKIQSKK